jgi:hypothetical protein
MARVDRPDLCIGFKSERLRFCFFVIREIRYAFETAVKSKSAICLIFSLILGG